MNNSEDTIPFGPPQHDHVEVYGMEFAGGAWRVLVFIDQTGKKNRSFRLTIAEAKQVRDALDQAIVRCEEGEPG